MKKLAKSKSKEMRSNGEAKGPSEGVFLCNQICFSLYTASRMVSRAYQPLLEKLDLTYPQYLVMLSLWQNDNVLVSDLCEKLDLDTGTISPLLKKLENKKYIQRERQTKDERKVSIRLTAAGIKLRINAEPIKNKMLEASGFESKELEQVKKYLDLLSQNFSKIGE